MEFVFPEVRTENAEPFDLLHDAQRPETLALSPGYPLLVIKSFGYLASLIELLTPEIQSRTLDPECLNGCLNAVSFPEYEDTSFLERFWCNHIRRA